MLERLKELALRRENLEAQLTDPAVYGDGRKLAAIQRELKELTPVVEAAGSLEAAERRRAEAEALSANFDVLSVGRPLLADTADLLRFAAGLAGMYPREEGGAVVLMGHGTEHFANAVYPALQTALRLAGREDVLVGTVEGWPGLEDVVRQLAPEGPRHIRLAPLMLVAGEHARSDMAGEWKGRLEAAGHTVQCAFTGLGELPWVQEMYQERLTALLKTI